MSFCKAKQLTLSSTFMTILRLSAYSNVLHSILVGLSLIKRKHKRASKLDPCGTPDVAR